MYYTRCLACKVALVRETPFKLLDRVCGPCLDVLRARAYEEQFYLDELDELPLAR